MFISKLRYDALIETIADSTKTLNTAYEYIEKLKAENKQLRQDKVLLLNMLKGTDPFDIDYPDTKGGNVVNTHLDSIDHTSTYPTQRHNDGTQFFRF